MKNIYLITLIAIFISACKKEKISNIPDSKGVYIINEGLFGFGNGEISFYDPANQQITNNLFSTANGYSLGDVVQSFYIRDSIGFIVVNNSQKVEMVKIPSFQKIRTITLANSSPRYLLPVNDSIAYITELYSNKIHVINYQSGVLVKEIPVPQYTEHLIMMDEFVFVEGRRIHAIPSSKGALLRIRISDHSYVDTKLFAGDAAGIVKDSRGHLWVAVEEDSSTSTPASLQSFDKDFNPLVNASMANMGYRLNHLGIEPATDKLRFLSGKDMFGADAHNGYSPSLLWTTTASNPYSFDIDPATGEIYLADALDFVQASRIMRYDKNGNLLHSFTAGIISGNFAFND